MRILIAEDDETSRRILSVVLTKGGHEVVTAANGLQAWEVLQAPDAPSLAILDWVMPGFTGPEVVSRVRAVQTECPPYLLMLTTRSEKADIVQALDTGADDYLTKPFDPQELLARVAVGARLVDTQAALATKVGELREALEHIKVLRGVVPICAKCKRIRDDSGYWNQVEIYIRERSDLTFSHGVCPTCFKDLYPEFGDPADFEDSSQS